MKLEELPEIKKGTIAEIGYVELELEDEPNSHSNELELKLYYVEGIKYIEDLPTFDTSPHFGIHAKPVKGQKLFPALKVYGEKLLNREKDHVKFFFPEYIILEAIVSYKPLEFKPIIKNSNKK